MISFDMTEEQEMIVDAVSRFAVKEMREAFSVGICVGCGRQQVWEWKVLEFARWLLAAEAPVGVDEGRNSRHHRGGGWRPRVVDEPVSGTMFHTAAEIRLADDHVRQFSPDYS